VVVLKNGDHLTGEVQHVERGRLQLSTDDMGTIQIEWDKVVSVTSPAPFDVDDLDGNRYLGSLLPSTTPGRVQIAWKGQTDEIEMARVVRVRRLDTSFWRRLDGALDVGASYSSGTSLFKLDLAGNLGIERPGFGVKIEGSSTLSSQEGAEDTRRNSLSLDFLRRYRNRWVAFVRGLLEQNRELGFDLRTAGAAGGGHYLLQRSQDSLLAGCGLSVNRERPIEGDSTTNVEAMAFLTFDRFSYDSPKVDIAVGAVGYVSLSDSGRWRLELEGQIKREIVKDFYATLRGYESYDSRPATEGARTNDYGATFALGWSF
jgi:hypothetical protein